MVATQEHTITGIWVRCPSTVGVGESFAVGVKLLTEPFVAGAACYGGMGGPVSRYNTSPRGIQYMDNVPPEWRGVLEIDGGDACDGPARITIDGGRPVRRVEGFSFRTPGVGCVTVRDPATGLVGQSNPIEVTAEPPAERLWWAEPHSQTFFSDGLRCPEELYTFARDEAFLDVFSISDHSESLTDRQWEYFVKVTNDFNAPGRFATLVALEWTSRKWGHRNAYFRGDWGPIWRCNDPVVGELPNLHAAAREHGALLVPHHSANAEMGCDWSLGHDPEVERLVEIHSIWGTSERPAEAGNPYPIRNHGGEKAGQHVLDALERGYRFGFVGGGDIHDGRPGDELHTAQPEMPLYEGLWRQGVTGIWAPELTREAIFDALWNRRVYATTNARILLRFSVAGEPMGGTVTADGAVPIRTHVVSRTPITRVEVVRNGTAVHTIEPGECEVDWEVADAPPAPGACYYVRVQRADGQFAWSSPVWTDRA